MGNKLGVSVLMILILCAFVLSGCFNGDEGGSSAYDQLPEPEEGVTAEFKTTGMTAMTTLVVSGGMLGNTAVSYYSADSFRSEEPSWSFGLDRESLTSLVGEEDLALFDANMENFIGDIFTHPSVLLKLSEAVSSNPHFNGVNDIESAIDISGAEIKSVYVADGVVSGGESRSMIGVHISLPFVYDTGGDISLGDCGSIISLVEESGIETDFVHPQNAKWGYEIDVHLMFFTEDRSVAHEGALAAFSGDIITDEENSAVAKDSGLIIWFLENLNSHVIPSYDAIFVFKASHELTSGTLGIIQGYAKESEDTSCLMAVDAFMPESSVNIPHITGSAYLDTDYTYFVHRYNSDLDDVNEGDEFGSSCLHDKNGSIVVVDGELACASASGPYSLTEDPAASKSGVKSFKVGSPYKTAAALVVSGEDILPEEVYGFAMTKTTSGICNAWPWNHLRTHRFGRGIRLAVSELAIHGQVADYWNIHYYQRPGSAGIQSAISAGAFVIKIVATNAIGGGSWWGIALGTAGEAYKLAKKFNISIAGYRIGGGSSSRMGDLFAAIMRYATLSSSVKEYLTMIAVAQTVEAVAQMAQTQATGWQDYYSGSHKVCGYKFK